MFIEVVSYRKIYISMSIITCSLDSTCKFIDLQKYLQKRRIVKQIKKSMVLHTIQERRYLLFVVGGIAPAIMSGMGKRTWCMGGRGLDQLQALGATRSLARTMADGGCHAPPPIHPSSIYSVCRSD
jgi:hypothetical protein